MMATIDDKVESILTDYYGVCSEEAVDYIANVIVSNSNSENDYDELLAQFVAFCNDEDVELAEEFQLGVELLPLDEFSYLEDV